MAMILRQSTASQEILLGPFVDSADGNTAETALSIANTDIKIFKEGATTLADKNSGGATHISNGYYYTVLDATDTNTVGQLEVNVKVSGALAVRREFQVVEEAVYDALFAASAAGYQVPIWAAAGSTVNLSGTTVKAVTDRVTANTDQWNGTAVTSATVRSDLINIAGVAVSTSTAQLGVNVVNIGGSATPVTNIGTVFNTDFATNYNATIDMWNVNVENWNTTAVPAEHTAGYPIVTVKDGTGTGEINTNAGAIALVDLVTTTTTATNVTTVNGLAAGVITAAAIATDAIDADALAADAIAEINATVDTALADIHLDHLIASADPGAVVANSSFLAKLVSKSATPAFSSYDNTTDSLEALRDRGDTAWITATGFSTHSASDVWAVGTRVLTAATNISGPIADQVWDESLSGHLSAGSTGEALNAAGAAGDPWTTALPGAYGAGSAGYIIGTNLNATVSSRSSHSAADVWSAGTRTLTAIDEDSTTLDLDATVRAAVGMASANLDTQLDALPTAAENATAVWAAGTRTLTSAANITSTGGTITVSTGAVTVGTNNDKTGYTLSTAGLAALFTSDSGTTYASAVAGSVVKEIADNAGGSGLTAAAIADAVWDEAISGHLTSGTTGNKLNAASSAGDPWSTTLPGSYTGTEAGFILGTLRAAQLNILSPLVATDNSIEIVIGDDYYAADNRNLSFSYGASPSLSGATVTLEIQEDTTAADSDTNYTSTTGTVSGTNPQVVSFDLPGTTTDDLSEGWHAYRVKAVLSNTHTVTLTRGRMKLLQRGDDAPRT